jgi:hypothetical protein
MNNWEIIDSKGTIDSGTQEEMQFIWDCNTRSITDLYNEYAHTYSKAKVKYMFSKNQRRWTGDLKLIEVHAITK